MSLKISVVSEVGVREFDAADLPLRIATSAGSQIPVAGPASAAPLAVVDVLDDAPFIQPGGAHGTVQVNGEPLTASRRLRDGDDIETYGTHIPVSLNEGELRLQIVPDESRYITAPPVTEEAAGEEEEEIAPIAFRRREIEQSRTEVRRAIPWHWWTGGALAVLTALA